MPVQEVVELLGCRRQRVRFGHSAGPEFLGHFQETFKFSGVRDIVSLAPSGQNLSRRGPSAQSQTGRHSFQKMPATEEA
jgi:hypothetical protein